MPADQVANLKGSVFAWLWEALGEARMACMDDAEAVISNCIVVPGRERASINVALCQNTRGRIQGISPPPAEPDPFSRFQAEVAAGTAKSPSRTWLETKKQEGRAFFRTGGGGGKNMRGLVIKACANNMVFVSIERRYHTHLRNWWNSKGRARELREVLNGLDRLQRSNKENNPTFDQNKGTPIDATHYLINQKACPNWLFSALNNEAYNRDNHKALADRALKNRLILQALDLGNKFFAFNPNAATRDNSDQCVTAVHKVRLPLDDLSGSGKAVVIETRETLVNYEFAPSPQKTEADWERAIRRWREFLQTNP